MRPKTSPPWRLRPEPSGLELELRSTRVGEDGVVLARGRRFFWSEDLDMWRPSLSPRLWKRKKERPLLLVSESESYSKTE